MTVIPATANALAEAPSVKMRVQPFEYLVPALLASTSCSQPACSLKIKINLKIPKRIIFKINKTILKKLKIINFKKEQLKIIICGIIPYYKNKKIIKIYQLENLQKNQPIQQFLFHFFKIKLKNFSFFLREHKIDVLVEFS